MTEKATEEFKISGEEILKKVKKIIEDGNAHRIIIKNEKDEVVVEFPVPVAAISLVLAPFYVGIGAMAALLTSCTIIVEKKEGK